MAIAPELLLESIRSVFRELYSHTTDLDEKHLYQHGLAHRAKPKPKAQKVREQLQPLIETASA